MEMRNRQSGAALREAHSCVADQALGLHQAKTGKESSPFGKSRKPRALRGRGGGGGRSEVLQSVPRALPRCSS